MPSPTLTRRDLSRLALLSPFAAAAGLAPSPSHAATPTRGGTFSYGLKADYLSLDPVNTIANADIWLSLNLYDTLVQPTLDGAGIEPGLAESWTVSQDGKTVTLKIRPNLKFADGSPLELSDIKWSLDRASNKDIGGGFQFLLNAINTVEIAGTDTIVLHLSRPNPAILEALATFNAGIVPQKLLMTAPGKDLTEKAKNFASKPIGCGPFVVSSWTHGSEIVLARNPYYWKQGADGKPLPYLDRVRLVTIPDDATRILKVKAGELDGCEFVPFSRVAELKADPKLHMMLYPAAQVLFYNVFCAPTYKDGSKNPTHDVRVRQALNYAVDKQALIQVLTYGNGVPQQSFLPMSTPLAYGKGEPYPYNIPKAKQLMQEAGYANGFEISCMAIAGYQDDLTKLLATQQMWSQINVRLKIEQLEHATLWARWRGSDFQMRTQLWTNDINDPNEMTGRMAYAPVIHADYDYWNNDKINQLFVASQSETDKARRSELYKQIQEIYVAEAPMIFLVEVPYPVALSKQVHGFYQIPLGNNILAGTYKT
ncbi:MAG: ABC transporter substrate-binding protein [Acetobacteraceae bacterium]